MADSTLCRWLMGMALLALAVGVRAEDIRLNNGRVLSDAVIQSQSARKVVVVCSEGLVSVEKRLLPEALRKEYPVYPEKFDMRPEVRNGVGSSARAVDNLTKKKTTEAETTPVEPDKKTEAELRWFVRSDAAERAENVFFEEERYDSDFKMCKVQIDQAKPVEGEENVWFVSGRATMYRRIYGAPERDTSSIGDAEWRNRHNGTTWEPAKNYGPAESKMFEGRYRYDPEGNSTLEITRR